MVWLSYETRVRVRLFRVRGRNDAQNLTTPRGTFTGIAMFERLSRQRALRGIARDLADSDPRLEELFFSFNAHVSGEEMPREEKIKTTLPGLIARIGRRVRHTSADPYGMHAWPP